ncbi:MAG: glycosyltransferase family 39 protein [Planctomycetes bacterium]|nr:glycosyltransferase family 39 protein [Planctomycetota bacterium]
MRTKRFELVVFLVALGLRLVAVWQYQQGHPNALHPVIDEASYDRWARAIAGGDWLGHEVFFQEPLYPYALGALYALLGPVLLVARVAQCGLWALTAVLCGRIARRAFGEIPGRLAAGLVALYGPGMIFPALLLKENLFLPLFALFALLLLDAQRRRAWFALGVLGALCALLRGNMLVLLPLFALWPLGRERSRAALLRGLAFAGGVLLVLLPVAFRNQQVGGVFALTTAGAGTNLYGGNNSENPWGRASEFSFVRGVPEHEADDWKHEAERRSGRQLDRGEVSRFWMGEAGRSLRAQPLLHLSILWNKLRLSLGRYEVPDNHFLEWDARYVPLARLPWPDFGVVGALGIAGILLVLRSARAGRELALLFLLYLGTIVLTVTSDRARLPLLVPLAPMAAFALLEVWRVARPRAVAALAVGAFFALVPALPPGERAHDLDERDYNLAVQRLSEPGGLGEAHELADSLAQRQPRSARVRLLGAQVELRARGEGGAARPTAEIERELEPLAADERLRARERFHAAALLGELALERHDFERAARFLAQARAFDPGDPRLRLQAATAECGELELAPADLARTQAALHELLELDALALDAELAAAVRCARCGAQFLLGRALLHQDPADAGGQAFVQGALEGLKQPSLDKSLAPPLRARARRLAGTIQLYLGKLESAQNHFRAALALEPGLTEARVGLAETLLLGAEKGESRDKAEIEKLLEGLEAPALRERLSKLP